MSTSTLSKKFSSTLTRAVAGENISAPSLASVSARELIDLFERSSDAETLTSVEAAWVDSVGVERAAVELIRVMHDGSSRQRATAFSWLSQLPSVAEAAVRVSLDDPVVRPYGVVWLREMGLPGPRPTPEEMRWLYVDLLAVALDDERRLAPTAFRQVAAGGSVDEQVVEVADLWRCRHPATPLVLDLICRLHAEPAVVKAAQVAAAKCGMQDRR